MTDIATVLRLVILLSTEVEIYDLDLKYSSAVLVTY